MPYACCALVADDAASCNVVQSSLGLCTSRCPLAVVIASIVKLDFTIKTKQVL